MPTRSVSWDVSIVVIATILNLALFLRVFAIGVFSDPIFLWYYSGQHPVSDRVFFEWLHDHLLGGFLAFSTLVPMILASQNFTAYLWLYISIVGCFTPHRL